MKLLFYNEINQIKEGVSMATIGIPGLILILIIALVIFGPKKLPEIGKAAGQTLREFKKSTKDLTEDVTEEIKDAKDIVKGQETK